MPNIHDSMNHEIVLLFYLLTLIIIALIINQSIVAYCRLERDTLLSSFLRPGAFAHAELCRAPIAKP